MEKYEHKINHGSLIKSKNKFKETSNDYYGDINVKGELFKIKGWINKFKDGTPYLGLVLEPIDAPDVPNDNKEDDNVPF